MVILLLIMLIIINLCLGNSCIGYDTVRLIIIGLILQCVILILCVCVFIGMADNNQLFVFWSGWVQLLIQHDIFVSLLKHNILIVNQ